MARLMPYGHNTAYTNMKTSHKTKNLFNQAETKNLTLGDIIAATYGACGERGAGKFLQLAMEANLIKYSRPQSH